jgi:signal transduction histidine kinase
MQETTNILLVDDKPERLLTYEATLASLGQNLVRAGSGEEALRRLAEREFAAILLDVNMPGMDGFETAARIREAPQGAQTPIIFITGVHLTDLDQLKGYEMGAADYVYIPVVPEILRGKVQVLIQLHLQRRELMRLNEQLVASNAALAKAHEELKAESTRDLQLLNDSLEAANAQLRLEVEERRRAEHSLTEEARRKDEFISILAHELRNPLSAIQSGVELMRLANISEEKSAWARELLARQVQHLMRLIEDLLDVSRVTSGRVRLQVESMDLKTAITQSVDATQPLIDSRRHDIRVELPAQPLHVCADGIRLTQVFGNLLTNAAKYMEEGGRIYVTAAAEPGPEPRAIVRIRDEGPGLPAEMLESVFELFTQADSSRTQSGLGIGLALVRSLVELHGGSVRATSDGLGCGCEFVVELPLSADAEIRQPLASEPGRRETAPLRLLIVDDNIDAAEGLALYLRASAKHEVWIAHDGLSGLASADEFGPDIVLLDIGLPDIDGYEVARRLRSRARPVLLVAMTGYSSKQDRKLAQEAGFDHFLVKPVRYADLEGILADGNTHSAPDPKGRSQSGAAKSCAQ